MTEEGGAALSTPPGQPVPTVTKKKRIRGGYRAHCKKLFAECRALFEAQEARTTQIERLCISLKNKSQLLRSVDEEIFLSIDEADIENEVIEAEDWQSEIQGYLVELEAKKAPTTSQVNQGGSHTSSPSLATPIASSPSDHIVNLPKLQLPKFAGDPKKWQEFWDAFGIIDGNDSLSDVNKFRHLKTLLEGQAASAIAGIQTTGVNYQLAIDHLKDRFAQKQVIINSHIDALHNLPNLTTEKDVKGLRKLADSIDINIRSLKNLGYDLSQYGPFLNPVIMNKLPEGIRLAVTKQIRKEEWELGKILDIVKTELDAREQCAYLSGKPTDSSAGKQVRSQLPTTSALLNASGKVSCSFCKGSHPSAKCNIVTDPQQRKAILRKQGRCYVCLKKAHLAKYCTSRIYCFNCRQRHHASICDGSSESTVTTPAAPVCNLTAPNIAPQFQPNQSMPTTTNTGGPRPGAATQTVGPSTVTMHVDTKTSVLLQTAKGYISPATDPERVAVARLILDSGSKHSYISENLRAALHLQPVTQETLTIKVFGEETGTLQTCDVVQFCVRSPYNGLNVFVTAYVVPVLCAPLSDQAIDLAASSYPHLAGLWLADFPAQREQQLNCEILIGSNFYWHFLTGRCIKGESGPVALESTLGWILSGPVHDSSERRSTHVNIAETHVLQFEIENKSNEASLEGQVCKFWELEGIGISKNEATVYESFKDEIAFLDGRYEVKLPWKPEHPTLPDNYLQSKKRLMGIFSRLKGNPTLLSEYDSIIREQEIRGIIERVDPTCDSGIGQVTYLPHHPVIRQDKMTTKVRVVYDASAKDCMGTSLNSCLYTGPCLLKTVAEIMTRFRLFPFALTSDIEKAFLMISIWPPDRDVLRFLWMDDVNSSSPQIITYRFTRVVFGVSCSPFLLNATLRRHIESYSENYPEVCQRLVNSLYVDDVNTGGYSIEEVMELFRVSKQMMQEGGFNLRKWLSNSKEVMSQIKSSQSDGETKVPNEADITEEDQSFAKTVLNVSETSEGERVKVLGLNWNSDTDNIVFCLSQLASTIEEGPVTKRKILRLIAKIFDPLGLITPVTTPLKVFLQKLFQQKVGWDEHLQDDLADEWAKLHAQLVKTREISVPRYYFGNIEARPAEIELYGFCDSSKQAYAAAVYAKITVEGKSSVSLVMSKSRVAPLAQPTIPRLELLSALILARLITSVKDALSPLFCNVKIVRCWTDSITTMYWIKGDEKQWKMFVDNRVQEIRKLVKKDLWQHCPGTENPADIPTRNNDPSRLTRDSRWFSGPKWLAEEEENWPEQKTSMEPTEDCLAEMKPAAREKDSTALLIQAEREHRISRVVDCERYSSYSRLLRVTAYVFRFINNCRERNKRGAELTAKEIEEAETKWICDMQSEFSTQKLTDLKKHLGNFVDNHGIIRCQGRLARSLLSYETKHPILLPKEHHITTLIIWDCHKRVLHNGTKETLQELRSRFWIVQGRQLVKKIIRRCVLCKRIQGASYGTPKQGPLPEFRVKEEHAFSSIGIDFAGPLFVREPSGESKKTYVALFTCGTSRAVHLELVPDLTAETFLLCFRRFVSRRGTPRLVVTDNAKTFKAFSKTLVKIFKTAEIQAFLARKRITWKFNVAKAAWWGGFYERLIKGVKLCLKKCVGTARISSDELHTVLVEIEGVLNSRPLTYQYPDSLTEPLTPSHLVTGRRLLQLPTGGEGNDEDEEDFYQRDKLHKRSSYISKLLDHYWNRWKHEYLVDLREHHRVKKCHQKLQQINVGDVVTIQDENRKNRSFWRLGKVLELLIGRDNVTRGAKLLLANGNRIERPIQKLYPLEVSKGNLEIADHNVPDQDHDTPPGRPKRAAAVVAEETMKIIDQLENDELD